MEAFFENIGQKVGKFAWGREGGDVSPPALNPDVVLHKPTPEIDLKCRERLLIQHITSSNPDFDNITAACSELHTGSYRNQILKSEKQARLVTQRLSPREPSGL